MTAFYERILEKIIQKEPLDSGKSGYYFALAHSVKWWELLDHLAAALKARGLINDTTIDVWPSDEAAAEAINVPAAFVQALWNSGYVSSCDSVWGMHANSQCSENMITNNERRLGWKPQWDKERFLKNIDLEIDAVVEEGKAKSSLMDVLRSLGN
jgi:hypothetical protein